MRGKQSKGPLKEMDQRKSDKSGKSSCLKPRRASGGRQGVFDFLEEMKSLGYSQVEENPLLSQKIKRNTKETKTIKVNKVDTRWTKDHKVNKVDTRSTKDHKVNKVDTRSTKDHKVNKIDTRSTKDRKVNKVDTRSTKDHKVNKIDTRSTKNHKVNKVDTRSTKDHKVNKVDTRSTQDYKVNKVDTRSTKDYKVNKVDTRSTKNHKVSKVDTRQTKDHKVNKAEIKATMDHNNAIKEQTKEGQSVNVERNTVKVKTAEPSVKISESEIILDDDVVFCKYEMIKENKEDVKNEVKLKCLLEKNKSGTGEEYLLDELRSLIASSFVTPIQREEQEPVPTAEEEVTSHSKTVAPPVEQTVEDSHMIGADLTKKNLEENCSLPVINIVPVDDSEEIPSQPRLQTETLHKKGERAKTGKRLYEERSALCDITNKRVCQRLSSLVCEQGPYSSKRNTPDLDQRSNNSVLSSVPYNQDYTESQTMSSSPYQHLSWLTQAAAPNQQYRSQHGRYVESAAPPGETKESLCSQTAAPHQQYGNHQSRYVKSAALSGEVKESLFYRNSPPVTVHQNTKVNEGIPQQHHYKNVNSNKERTHQSFYPSWNTPRGLSEYSQIPKNVRQSHTIRYMDQDVYPSPGVSTDLYRTYNYNYNSYNSVLSQFPWQQHPGPYQLYTPIN